MCRMVSSEAGEMVSSEAGEKTCAKRHFTTPDTSLLILRKENARNNRSKGKRLRKERKKERRSLSLKGHSRAKGTFL